MWVSQINAVKFRRFQINVDEWTYVHMIAKGYSWILVLLIWAYGYLWMEVDAYGLLWIQIEEFR